MKAIETRSLPATSTKNRRIVASDNDNNRVVVENPGGIGPLAHWPAVQVLCAKMGWHGMLVPGATKGGYAWVWLEWIDSTKPADAVRFVLNAREV